MRGGDKKKNYRVVWQMASECSTSGANGDRRIIITQDVRTPYGIVREGTRRFTIAWRTEGEMTAENHQRKREEKEANMVVFAPGVTPGKLRRFRAVHWLVYY